MRISVYFIFDYTCQFRCVHISVKPTKLNENCDTENQQMCDIFCVWLSNISPCVIYFMPMTIQLQTQID